MKLRNLLHIRENDIHVIGTLIPPFFCRVSSIMEDFIQLCNNNSVETALDLIKEKYPPTEFEAFEERINKVKDKLFVNDDYRETPKIDLSAKISTLTLNVTRKCNLKCSYCFEDSGYRKLGNMPFAVAKKAIDTFFTDNSSNWVIIFTGGEPLLNFNLLKEVTEYIDNKGLKVEYRIKTNATLLDDGKMDFLIKNNFKIQVSLDGNAKAHDTHRKFANGKGSFEIVDNTIKKLIEKNYGSNVSISGTVTHQTIKFIEDSYSYLNSYDVIRYDLKTVMPNSKNQYVFDKNDYKISCYSLLKNNKYMMDNAKKFTNVKNNIKICGIGLWNITVDTDAKIYPCYRMCGYKEYVIGNLDELVMPFKLPQRLIDIYKMEDNIECSKCALINSCKSGCYTDKLVHELENNKCFQQVKIILEDIICNELNTKKIHLLLDVV